MAEHFDIKKELPPPGQTRWSTLLNGMGNGIMLVGGGAWVGEQTNGLLSNPIPQKSLRIFSIAAVTVGGVIGAIHGLAEGRNIQNYREALAEKIDHLEDQTMADRVKMEELYRAVQAKEQARAR